MLGMAVILGMVVKKRTVVNRRIGVGSEFLAVHGQQRWIGAILGQYVRMKGINGLKESEKEKRSSSKSERG